MNINAFIGLVIIISITPTIYIPNWYEVMQNIQEKWLTKKK